MGAVKFLDSSEFRYSPLRQPHKFFLTLKFFGTKEEIHRSILLCIFEEEFCVAAVRSSHRIFYSSLFFLCPNFLAKKIFVGAYVAAVRSS